MRHFGDGSRTPSQGGGPDVSGSREVLGHLHLRRPVGGPGRLAGEIPAGAYRAKASPYPLKVAVVTAGLMGRYLTNRADGGLTLSSS